MRQRGHCVCCSEWLLRSRFGHEIHMVHGSGVFIASFLGALGSVEDKESTIWSVAWAGRRHFHFSRALADVRVRGAPAHAKLVAELLIFAIAEMGDHSVYHLQCGGLGCRLESVQPSAQIQGD